MNRRSLIKSLFTIAVAPKVLTELNLGTPAASNPIVRKSLISDLQLLTPQFYKSYVEKYGNENFSWWLSTYGNSVPITENKYFWYEKNRQTTDQCQNT